MAVNRQAVIRCDGGPKIGLGHVSRCLALAESLATSDWRCRFAMSSDTQDSGMVSSAGFEILMLDRWDDAAGLSSAVAGRADLLVIDHYGLDEDYEQSCRGFADALLAFDDEPMRSHRCDLLVNSAASRAATAYRGLVTKHGRLLLGPDFICLRSSFAAARARALLRRQEEREVSRVYVSFGAVDSIGLCNVALAALAKIDRPLNIDVAIGGAAPHLDVIREIGSMLPHTVTVHVDSMNMADLLCAADLALGAAGVNAWERCVLGVPSVLVAVAGNQTGTYADMTEAGAALGIGDAGDDVSSRLDEAMRTLMESDYLRADMSRKAAALCDGIGAQRVSSAVAAHIKRKCRVEYPA
jgi:UDP-2,4-diacetamido-2,4,6-trideoxy-beta-L-altropyranose hydrolase